MKFVVSRTSVRDDETKPCDVAFIEELTYINFRTVSTLKEAERYFWFENWYKSGVNHREEKGMIACDCIEKRKEWCIEIDNLDDLLKFMDEHGEVIITGCGYKEIDRKIEIYDDYRE